MDKIYGSSSQEEAVRESLIPTLEFNTDSV